MINLLSAATATPRQAFKTTDLTNALMHKLSPELINTLNSLGVDQRYSVMENYPDFLSGKPMQATSSTTELGVAATKRCIEEWQGIPADLYPFSRSLQAGDVVGRVDGLCLLAHDPGPDPQQAVG